MPDRTLYQVLGVSRNATPEQIREAWRQQLKVWHPDRTRHPAAELHSRELNEAYEVLSNPSRRAEYDLTLKAESARTPRPRPAASSAPPVPGYPPRLVPDRRTRAAAAPVPDVVAGSALAPPTHGGETWYGRALSWLLRPALEPVPGPDRARMVAVRLGVILVIVVVLVVELPNLVLLGGWLLRILLILAVVVLAAFVIYMLGSGSRRRLR